MAFPALSRRQVATPVTRCRRKSRRAHRPTAASASPRKCARSESLRSTWMTNGSDSNEDEPDAADDVDAELQVFVQLQRPLSDWVYWQRDAAALPDCWTRVFAVFCGDLLWLYRYEDAAARSLLLRTRVTALDVGAERQLHFRDAAANVCVRLFMPDAPAFHRWQSHVSTAVARFPPVEEESARTNAVAPAVAAAMQKKSFWTAMATAVVAGAKASRYHQVAGPQAALIDHGRGRKSLGQRWKSVAATLKSALKIGHRHPQLQL